jgi:SAM-dependent methyltransferase
LPSVIENYDLVLSTQVLEHVEDPLKYLSECARALKDDGLLALTTHGLFEDHPCPNDYWRWTAQGLETIVKQSGLVVERMLKITCGPRAALFHLERDLGGFGGARNVFKIYPLLFGVIWRLGRRRLHSFADRKLGDFCVRDAGDPRHDPRYVAIGLLARKAR